MSGTMSTTFRRSLAAIAMAGMTALAITTMAAQQKNEPRAPTFTVDPAWPSIPNNWMLGEVTSIATDSRDHIWVLHVPGSIPESQRANAAPPVLEFDQAGKLLTSWGGPTGGEQWLGREHGIFVDADNYVWIGGRAGWPRPTTPGLSDDVIMKFTTAGKLVMQIGHRGQSQGNLDSENVHQATDLFVDTKAKEVYAADGYGNKRVDRLRLRNRQVQAAVGRVRQPAASDVRPQPRRAAAAGPRRTAHRSSACRTRSRFRAMASSTLRTASTTASRCSRARANS